MNDRKVQKAKAEIVRRTISAFIKKTPEDRAFSVIENLFFGKAFHIGKRRGNAVYTAAGQPPFSKERQRARRNSERRRSVSGDANFPNGRCALTPAQSFEKRRHKAA